MNEIEKRQKKIRQTFAAFKDPDDKWKYLLKLSRKHPGMEPKLKQDKFLVEGCASRLFLVPKFQDGYLNFFMDTEDGMANPLISRGLGALAIKIYDHQKPADILASDPTFFQHIGLNVGLSPSRANGFASMLKQIYLYARVFDAMSR